MSDGIIAALIVAIAGIVAAIIAGVFQLVNGRVKQTTSSIPNGTATAISKNITPHSLYNQATSGNPVFNDPLTGLSANHWFKVSSPNVADENCDCVFKRGTYHVSVLEPDEVVGCYAWGTNFSNFALQVQMTILKGDGGGLLFRREHPETYGYRFFVGKEHYDLVFDNKILTSNYGGFKANLNQTYLLTVIARGNEIFLYVDKQWLASVKDSSASFGTIGLMAFDNNKQTEIKFSNVQIWSL